MVATKKKDNGLRRRSVFSEAYLFQKEFSNSGRCLPVWMSDRRLWEAPDKSGHPWSSLARSGDRNSQKRSRIYEIFVIVIVIGEANRADSE